MLKLLAVVFLTVCMFSAKNQAFAQTPSSAVAAAQPKVDAAIQAEFETARTNFKDFRVESVEEFAKIKEYHRQLMADGNLTHQFTLPGGHLVHCIEVGSQSAVRKSGIDPKTVGLALPTLPPGLAGSKALRPADPAMFGMDGSLDNDGNVRTCPPGSIPILIPSLQDLCRFKKPEDRFHKYPVGPLPASNTATNPPSQPPPPPDPTTAAFHEHSIISLNVSNLGAQAEFSVWQPAVQSSTEVSIEQLWVIGGSGSGTQTVETGWQVDYSLNFDWLPHFFIFFTTNNYNIINGKPTFPYGGGYNLYGSYFVTNQNASLFVQTSQNVIVGAPLPSSAVGGALVTYTAAFYHEPTTSNWWLFINSTPVGYYPITLFNAAGLGGAAATVEFGGEVVKDSNTGIHTTTQMGSGRFSASGSDQAATMQSLEYFDTNHVAQYATGFTPNITAPNYYDLQYVQTTPPYIYFGGPGERYQSETLAGIPQNQSVFNFPRSIAVDRSGNIYVADEGANVIDKVTPDGAVSILAGNPAMGGYQNGNGTQAQFSDPQAVAVDTSGNVYVADTGNSAIRVITPAGSVSTLVPPGAGLYEPGGVAVDTLGYVFVADTYNNAIRLVTANGLSTFAGSLTAYGSSDGTGSAALFNRPTSVTLDGTGTLYVSDSGNSTIRKVTRSAVVTTLASRAGNLGNNDGGTTNAEFENALQIAADAVGNIYVADYFNDEIRKVTPGGAVSTLAGAHYTEGTIDGVWTNALFDGPEGVAVDPWGNIYVADTHNFTVRKLFPQNLTPGVNTAPGSMSVQSGVFTFSVTGPPAAPISIQASSDLINWTVIATNTLGLGPLNFSDPQSATNSRRYYRVVGQ